MSLKKKLEFFTRVHKKVASFVALETIKSETLKCESKYSPSQRVIPV